MWRGTEETLIGSRFLFGLCHVVVALRFLSGVGTPIQNGRGVHEKSCKEPVRGPRSGHDKLPLWIF